MGSRCSKIDHVKDNLSMIISLVVDMTFQFACGDCWYAVHKILFSVAEVLLVVYTINLEIFV